MGRLFGAISRGPIYYDLFEEFADLAVIGNTSRGGPDERGHRDGWGLVFFRNGALVYHARGSGSARGDAQYYRTAWNIAKTNAERKAGERLIVIGHLRRASKDVPLGEPWSHPFVESKADRAWAFAHNGGLGEFAFDPDQALSDSEILFRELLANLEGSGPEDVAEATRATIANLRDRYRGYSSLNFLLSDGERLHAFREFADRGEYYTLYEDNFGEAILVCSQPILGMRDDPIAKGWLLSIGPDLRIVKNRVL